MTLYTRHGFVITEAEGNEERPPVYRCGGIGLCEEDTADYLKWRRQQYSDTVSQAELSGDQAMVRIRQLQRSTMYMRSEDGGYVQGFYDAMSLALDALKGDPDLIKALRAFS